MKTIIRENWREALSWLLECAVMVSLVVLAICGGLISTARTAELSRTAAYAAVSSLVWVAVFAGAVRRLESGGKVYIERWSEK